MTQDKYAILILHGSTAHDFLAPFNQEIARGIIKYGCDPVFIDLRDEQLTLAQLKTALDTYTRERILFAFTFHGFGTDIGNNTPQGNLWERLAIPVVSLMGDHPCYNVRRHTPTSPAIMMAYSSKDFLSFSTDYIKSPFRKAHLAWAPFTHGRTPHRREPVVGQNPLILLAKSGSNPYELQEDWTHLPQLMQRIIHDALDDYWAKPLSGPVTDSVLCAADARGVELRNDLSLFSFFMTQLDDFTRRVKTTSVIRDLISMPVTIYADKIDHIDTSKTRATLLPPIPNEKLVDLYQDALAIVSFNPNVNDSIHDRVFSALGTGALPLTDSNAWFEANCPDLVPYTFDFKGNGPAKAVEKVLADPVTAAETAWQASKRLCSERTFENTVLDGIDMGIMHRYFTFNFAPPQLYYIKPSL